MIRFETIGSQSIAPAVARLLTAEVVMLPRSLGPKIGRAVEMIDKIIIAISGTRQGLSELRNC